MIESKCDLARTFGGLAALVPDGIGGGSDLVFHAGVLPVPPSILSSDRILFRKKMHYYDGWCRSDALWMYLSSQKCRELGIFLLACAFHGPEEKTTLEVSHPDSEIRRIVFPAGRHTLVDPPAGLSMTPFAFRYFPAETEKFPWVHDCCAHDLPLLALSNADDCVGPTEDQWRERDTLWIRSSITGTFSLAELLLNAGCSWNSVREYDLEGEAGFRGVAPMSAELRIFLPGSDGWLFEGQDVPVVSSKPANNQSR